MKIFNPTHVLRHISMPTLREFIERQPIAHRLTIDWDQPEQDIPEAVIAAHRALEESLNEPGGDAKSHDSLLHDLYFFQEDLRRVHLMSDELAITALRRSRADDEEALEAFANRDAREQAIWMLCHREQAFRDIELRLAFQAKVNGKFWKKHRIQAGLVPSQDRDRLEAFCDAVANLYKKVGGGPGTHIEFSRHTCDGSIQITLYIEGPLTTLTHFSDRNFKRVPTRIALESALVYHPNSGVIETIVKGGEKNHVKVLALFGAHLVGQEITPQAIEPARFNLDVLRDGNRETFDDLSVLGIEKIRLRRACLKPRNGTGMSVEFDASPEEAQDDAITVARDRLKDGHTLDSEFNMVAASVIVYLRQQEGQRSRHFSFDVQSTGRSTIRNLSRKNQPLAQAALKALNVITADEVSV